MSWLKFKVGFDTEYDTYGTRDGSWHVIYFTITFTDEEDSARKYFENVWRDEESIDKGGLEGQTFNLGEKEFEWESYYFNDDMGEPLVLNYKFEHEDDDDDSDDEFEFDDNDMRQFKQSVLKAIYKNWDTAFLPAMNYTLEDGDSPTMNKQFYSLFYQALKKRMLNVNPNLNIYMTLQIPLQDPCNVRKLKTYEPRELVKGKAQPSAITYTFKDGGKTFTVQYFHKHKEARVRFIECDDTSNKKCTTFKHNLFEYNDQKIIGHWTDDRIEIDLVYLGDACVY